MKKTASAWAFAALTLFVFTLLASLMPGWLKLAGGRAIALRIGLVFFGIVAGGLVYLFLAARAKARGNQPVAENDTTDQTMAAAEAHLARSAAAGNARIRRLPLVLLLGPAGSTKTSII